jgi:tetratricopeptide (TPR) repeat protein
MGDMALIPHPAIAYLEQGQYETGAQLCEQAIAAEPDDAIHYWYLGLCRLLQADPTEAQAVWMTAIIALAPETLDSELQALLQILWQAGADQLNQGDAQRAALIYQQILELDADQSLAHLHLGEALCLQGKLDEAIACWQTATQLQPDCVEAYIQQAEVWQRLEQWDAAIAAYQQAIELQPTAELRYQLACCLGQHTQWGAALEQLNQVLRLEPTWSFAYSDRGWLHLELNQWTQATPDFHAALQIHSDYAGRYRHWVEQLQQANLPVSDRLQQNASQLNNLCLAAEEVWHQWVTSTPTTSPDTPPGDGTVAPPTGYFLDTATWVQSDPAAHYVPLDDGHSIDLKAPKTCDRSLHFSFRLEPEIRLPDTFVATVPQGRSWLSAGQSSSAILTATNELLGDLSPEFPLLTPGHPNKHPANHSIFRQQLPPVQAIAGQVAVIAGLTSDLYFHWMFDVLPRIDILQRSGINLESINYFLVNANLPFQQETLQRCGIPSAKILDPARYCHIQADQLIVPSYPSSPAWMTQRVCHWLQSLLLNESQQNLKRRDRFYITRQQASNRRLINESEVVPWLQAIGFRAVALETLTVQEQAELLASAEVVISVHGGGLTNLTFCQPGTKVIEIFSPNFVYPCYWLVSNLLHLDYYYVTGTILTGYFLHQHLYPNPRTEDIWLNLDMLKQTLQLAEVL